MHGANRREPVVVVQGVHRLGGLLLATLTECWMRTLDFRVVYYDPLVDPAHPQFQGRAVYVFWHEYIPFLFYLRGHCHIAMLLSRHRDAEWLAYAARYRGFDTIRGSTNRGGAAAVLEIFQRGRTANLAITPDGPRGPRRVLALGPIFVASRLSLPLVPIGLGYDRPWRLNTWDRFAIPRPGSRARCVVGPKVFVPDTADRSILENYRRYVESLLNLLTDHAERWAHSGLGHQDERPLAKAAAVRCPNGHATVHQDHTLHPVPAPSLPAFLPARNIPHHRVEKYAS